jgi:3-phenylpropionate/trans-cinnamate dioxygenase ferredoxin reductase subunit
VPRFWSSQYDLRLQTVGLSQGYDRTVVRGDPKARSFSIIYFSDGRVIAIDSINASRDFAQGRHIVEGGLLLDPDKLADPNIPLQDMMND